MRGRRRIVERLVRTEGIEFVTPGIKAVLLRTAGVTGWSRTVAFERAMHAFVPADLLGRRGLDEIGEDTEADPPDGECGEAPEGLRRKRDAIVGADTYRQVIFLKGAQKDGSTLRNLRVRQRATAEQEAVVAVRDRQRITEGAIAETELAFEVGRPDRIWCMPGRRTRRAGTSAFEIASEGRPGRPRGGGMLPPRQPEQLAVGALPCNELAMACDDTTSSGAIGRAFESRRVHAILIPRRRLLTSGDQFFWRR